MKRMHFAAVLITSLVLASCVGNQAPEQSGSETSQQTQQNEQVPISISQPQPGDLVESPLTVTGEARGTWYFEASFPVRLLDGNGQEIAFTPAQAQGDWMTTDFVPFVATLTFTTPSTSTGMLVLEKDNPSGESQNDASVTIPVSF